MIASHTGHKGTSSIRRPSQLVYQEQRLRRVLVRGYVADFELLGPEGPGCRW